MTRILLLVWLVGMVPALWVVRGQWVGRRGAGARGIAWAVAWPVWVVFWMAEEAFGAGDRDGDRAGDGGRDQPQGRGGEDRRRR